MAEAYVDKLRLRRREWGGVQLPRSSTTCSGSVQRNIPRAELSFYDPSSNVAHQPPHTIQPKRLCATLPQLPTEGTLQLTYKAGKLICPKQSLLLEGAPDEVPSEAPPSGSNPSGQPHETTAHGGGTRQQAGATADQPRPGAEDVGVAGGDARVGVAGETPCGTTNAGLDAGLESGLCGGGAGAGRSGRASETGFEAMMYMLRSLGSPTQVRRGALALFQPACVSHVC